MLFVIPKSVWSVEMLIPFIPMLYLRLVSIIKLMLNVVLNHRVVISAQQMRIVLTMFRFVIMVNVKLVLQTHLIGMLTKINVWQKWFVQYPDVIQIMIVRKVNIVILHAMTINVRMIQQQ